jgi:predicted exporter
MLNISLIRKKHSLKKSRILAAAWIAVHLGLVLSLAVCAICGRRFAIDTNLFNILPQDGRSLGEADKRLSEKTGRNFFVLVSASEFADAKKTALSLGGMLGTDDAFEKISVSADSSVVDSLRKFAFRSRFRLLDKETIELLSEKNGPRMIADSSLTQVYGAFSFASLDDLERDPFLLSSIVQQSFMERALENGTSFSIKDGVLATRYNDRWYVMARGTLSAKGAAISSSHSGVKKIYEACGSLEKDGVEFVYSGVPFHSYESSTSAQTEISAISTVSMILVLILLIVLFRSVMPVALSMISIAVSALTAFASSLLVFGGMHILTFVFGTTLIGTCLDYSVHFFINRTANRKVSTGEQVRTYLFRGLTLSLASTEICYLVLLASPFTLLKQVAVFSFTGILSSYLTVVCLYPLLPPAKKQHDIHLIPQKMIRSSSAAGQKPSLLRKKISAAILIIIVIAAAVTIIINRAHIRVENNISSLYTMKGRLLENEKLSAKVINYGSSGWYFIVSGRTEDELLEHEESLCSKLDEQIARKNLGSYLAVSSFIPSPSVQKRSYEAAGRLIPLADEQLASLGFISQSSQDSAQKNSFVSDYTGDKEKIIYPESEDVPAYLKDMISSVWIGEVDGTYYSAVMPLHAQNESSFRKIAQEDENVFFINKVKDIGTELDKLTRQMMFLFAVSYAFIFIVLLFFYKLRNALCIIAIPPVITLVTIAVLSSCGIPLSFFPVTGLILVFGLGLDYIIYTVENENKITSLAIFVSFITTALSFGALALSTFVPVHIFGLTVFSGLTTAYVCSLIIASFTERR